ncbi:MAG: universal stress protein [Deltaproteobacteria bacterium]|nr:universal stress protein [Deltaproteobacteria bacterium]
MEIKRIIYTTNLEKATHDPIELLLGMKGIGLKEVMLLSSDLPEGLTSKLAEEEINCKTIDNPGPFVNKILDLADKENASLIVANMKRVKNRLFKRSAERDLITTSHIPVLLIHENGGKYDHRKKGLFDNVILATHWSDSARRAWLYIVGLKKILGAVDIVYVLNEKPTVKEIRQIKERIEEIRKICLEEKIDAESHIYAGKTPEEILLAAKEYNASLIIMGASSKNTIEKVFSRSVPFSVAEKAHVPVLIIP